ncbi:hypothetical protein [Bdellovibrio sp. HCB209]|uniref:hypothetical protein n=1 Tax=Bdellovibrio sp. HCB209 TaxID=3394354 RepID=UPI0039B53BAF
MKQNLSLLIAALTFSAMQAGAQSSSAKIGAASTANTSTSKIEDLKKPTEKLKDTDDEITDARMRASLGSKSKWSFKSSLNYNGGSLQEPLASVRPSYRFNPDRENMTSLSGNVGINVRITDRDSLSFGTGISITDPFHGDITKNAKNYANGANGTDTARYNISTPYLGWSRGYKAAGAQMITSLTAGYYTAELTKNRGYHSYLSLGQTVFANFGTSKWNGGVSFTVNKELHGNEMTDPNFTAQYKSGSADREEWTAGAYPFLQYSFNDRYSFRTVFGYAEFQKSERASEFIQAEPYQSMGVGISITRDIYLYPNVQFAPKDIRSDRTNVALSTNINLF